MFSPLSILCSAFFAHYCRASLLLSHHNRYKGTRNCMPPYWICSQQILSGPGALSFCILYIANLQNSANYGFNISAKNYSRHLVYLILSSQYEKTSMVGRRIWIQEIYIPQWRMQNLFTSCRTLHFSDNTCILLQLHTLINIINITRQHPVECILLPRTTTTYNSLSM